INEQVEAFYEKLADSTERENLVASATKVLRQRRNSLERRLVRAKSRLTEAESADRIQLHGDLIAANLHRIKSGDRWVEAQDYTNDNSSITIELRPTLSPRANAERYYHRAKKARRRRAALSEEVQNLEPRLNDTMAKLEEVGDAEISQLHRLLEEISAPARGRSKAGVATPGLQFVSGRFTILVGRNARENDLLLRHHVRGNDLWLHTRDYPGGYVFVRAQKGRTVPLDVLLDAGNLAVHYSKAKANGRAELYYTQVKYLRRAKNGPPGLVLPTNERNLSVVVEQDRLARLLA
ncbi:MAG: NFACT RNA binding domain-containing protein, partial [Spirochaetia bacterium]